MDLQPNKQTKEKNKYFVLKCSVVRRLATESRHRELKGRGFESQRQHGFFNAKSSLMLLTTPLHSFINIYSSNRSIFISSPIVTELTD